MQSYSNVSNNQPELWGVLTELELMCREETEAHLVRQRKYGELRCVLMSLIRREIGDSQKSQSVDRDVCMADSQVESVPGREASDSHIVPQSRDVTSVHKRQAIKFGSALTVPSSIPSENLVDTPASLTSITSSATLTKEDVYVNGVNNKREAFTSTHLPDAANSFLTKMPTVPISQGHNWKAVKIPVQSVDISSNNRSVSPVDHVTQDDPTPQITVVPLAEESDKLSIGKLDQQNVLPQIHKEDGTIEEDIEKTQSVARQQALIRMIPHKVYSTTIDDTTESTSKSPGARKLRPSRPIGRLSLKQRPWESKKKRRKSLLQNDSTIIQEEEGSAVTRPQQTIRTTSTITQTEGTSAELSQHIDTSSHDSPPRPPQTLDKRPRKITKANVIQDSDDDEEEPFGTTTTVATFPVQTAPTTPAAQPRKSNIASASSSTAKSRASRVRFEDYTTPAKGKDNQEEQEQGHEKENEHVEGNGDDKPETNNSRPRRRCSTNKPDYYKKIELPDDDDYEDMVEKVLKKGERRQRREDVIFLSETRKRRVNDVDDDNDDEDDHSQQEDEGDVMMPEA